MEDNGLVIALMSETGEDENGEFVYGDFTVLRVTTRYRKQVEMYFARNSEGPAEVRRYLITERRRGYSADWTSECPSGRMPRLVGAVVVFGKQLMSLRVRRRG